VLYIQNCLSDLNGDLFKYYSYVHNLKLCLLDENSGTTKISKYNILWGIFPETVPLGNPYKVRTYINKGRVILYNILLLAFIS
jgi:hypothetical protein